MTIEVYWGTSGLKGTQDLVNLIWEKPERLSNLIPGNPSNVSSVGNYRRCPAFKPLLQNTFVFTHPFSDVVTISGSASNYTVESKTGLFSPDEEPLKNMFRLNYNFGWLFFSKQPLKIRSATPYMHNTSDRKSGFIANGMFDISKWFRAINMTYILWEPSLTVTKGEPAIYIEFLSDEPVRLSQFEVTEELMDISVQSSKFTSFFKDQGLDVMYKKFLGSNRHKKTLKLIQENLLD